MTYNIEQFKQWLEQESNRRQNLPNWEEVFNQLGKEFTEKSLEKLANFAEYQEIIQEWVNSLEKEENSSQTSEMPGGFPTPEEKTLKKSKSTSDLKKKASEEPLNTDLTKELSKKIKSLEKNKERLETAWKKEKETLAKEVDEWKQAFRGAFESKEKFKKATEYLQEQLDITKKILANTQKELSEVKTKIQQQEQDFQKQFNLKERELNSKQEIITALQQRNADLQNRKLPDRDQEITQLKEWINKLESASANGNAWEQLQKDLANSEQTITLLQEQLSLKHPTNHYWVYTLVAVVIIYLALK